MNGTAFKERVRTTIAKHSNGIYHTFSISFWVILSFSFYRYLLDEDWFAGVVSAVPELWREILKDYRYISLSGVTTAIGFLIVILTPIIQFLNGLANCIRRKIKPDSDVSFFLILFIWISGWGLAGGHIISPIVVMTTGYGLCRIMEWYGDREQTKAVTAQSTRSTGSDLISRPSTMGVKE